MRRTDIADLVHRLAALPAFATLGRADLEELATHGYRSSVPANWPLIHQETPADACYILLDGEAAVTVRGERVATLAAGAVVGEVALATGRLRNATVTSLTALDLLHIDAQQFTAILDRRPNLRSQLLPRQAPAATPATT